MPRATAASSTTPLSPVNATSSCNDHDQEGSRKRAPPQLSDPTHVHQPGSLPKKRPASALVFCNMDAGMEANLVYPFDRWFNMNAYWQGEHNLDNIISKFSKAQHKKLSDGVFGSFLKLQSYKTSMRLLHCLLLSRIVSSDPNRLSFNIFGHLIHFGPEEYHLYTGLRFSASREELFDGPAINMDQRLLKQYFGGKSNLQVSDVRKFLVSMTTTSLVDEDDAVKIAEFYIFQSIILCSNKKTSLVEVHYLDIIDNEDLCRVYPWGSAGFEALVNSAMRPLKSGVNYYVLGFPFVLCAWFLDLFPTVRSNFCTYNSDGFPRMVRFISFKNPQYNTLVEHYFHNVNRFDKFKMIPIVLSEEEKRSVELNVTEAGPVVPVVAFKHLKGKEVVEDSEDTCDDNEVDDAQIYHGGAESDSQTEDGGAETEDGGAESEDVGAETEDDVAETEDDDHVGDGAGDDRQDARYGVELDQDLVNAIVKKVNMKFRKRLRSQRRRIREDIRKYIRGVDNKVDCVLDFMKKFAKNFEENEGSWRKDVSGRRGKEQSGSFRNSLNLYSYGGNASVGRKRKSPPDVRTDFSHGVLSGKSKSPSYKRQVSREGSVVRKSKSSSDLRKEVSGGGVGLNSARQLHGASQGVLVSETPRQMHERIDSELDIFGELIVASINEGQGTRDSPLIKEEPDKTNGAASCDHNTEKVADDLSDQPPCSIDANFLQQVEVAFDETNESQEERARLAKESISMNPSLKSTLLAILGRHGNITEDCPMESGYMLKSILEVICKVVQELQKKHLADVNCNLLDSYYLVVKDAEKLKLNVGWLRTQLDEINDAAKLIVETKKMNDEKNRRVEHIRNEKKDLDTMKVELSKLKSEVEQKESLLNLEALVTEELSNTINDRALRIQQFQIKPLMEPFL